MNLQDTARIRELNDAFHRSFVGGSVMLTSGVQALPERIRVTLLEQVRSFDAFDRANDPHQEHDFGSLDVDGQRFFWKLDYYDCDLRYRSQDPCEPAKTTRVLLLISPSNGDRRVGTSPAQLVKVTSQSGTAPTARSPALILRAARELSREITRRDAPYSID